MRWGLITAALLMAFGAFARSPQRELVTFSVTTNVGYGNEVFIVGNHEDLGNWDPTRGAKLVWHTNNVWSATLGIQSGTALDYKPVAMPNSYTGICNPANANWMPPGGGNHLTTNSPAEPDAPYVGKAMYYHTSWTNVVLIYSPDGTNFSTAPMTKIGPGRVSGESLFFINGIGEAGGSLQFIPYDGERTLTMRRMGVMAGVIILPRLMSFFCRMEACLTTALRRRYPPPESSGRMPYPLFRRRRTGKWASICRAVMIRTRGSGTRLCTCTMAKTSSIRAMG